MPKKILIITILITLALILIILFFRPKTNTSNSTNLANTGKIINSPLPKTQENYSTEEERLVLNFKDNQVVIKGYPLISKDYVKIFHFVYLGMSEDEDAFVQEEVNANQQGSYSYKLSSSQNKIYTGIGKDSSGQPIKQSLQIVPLDSFSEISQGCQITEDKINNLTAKSIDCPSFTARACWIAVDDKLAIFYKQESESKIADSNMCDNLKKNGISSISFQAY